MHNFVFASAWKSRQRIPKRGWSAICCRAIATRASSCQPQTHGTPSRAPTQRWATTAWPFANICSRRWDRRPGSTRLSKQAFGNVRQKAANSMSPARTAFCARLRRHWNKAVSASCSPAGGAAAVRKRASRRGRTSRVQRSAEALDYRLNQSSSSIGNWRWATRRSPGPNWLRWPTSSPDWFACADSG